MPVRSTKKFSERGSIKDLETRHTENISDNPPTPLELRLKVLYEIAEQSKNEALMESTGFIVMNNPGDKSAFPVTLFRHREKLNAICAKHQDSIKEFIKELFPIFTESYSKSSEMEKTKYKKANSLYAILDEPGIIKTASGYGGFRRSFRRMQ